MASPARAGATGVTRPGVGLGADARPSGKAIRPEDTDPARGLFFLAKLFDALANGVQLLLQPFGLLPEKLGLLF